MGSPWPAAAWASGWIGCWTPRNVINWRVNLLTNNSRLPNRLRMKRMFLANPPFAPKSPARAGQCHREHKMEIGPVDRVPAVRTVAIPLWHQADRTTVIRDRQVPRHEPGEAVVAGEIGDANPFRGRA